MTTITEDPTEPFTWAVINDNGTPVSWLKLNDYGQWIYFPADSFGNPVSTEGRMLDLGDEAILREFVTAFEALSMESSEAVKEALVTAHHAKLAVYKDETFDLACQIAKRRANRLDP
jgi:hypothetical protein